MQEQEHIEIRPETLRPFGQWARPTAAEVREMIRRTGGLTGDEVAELVGVGHTGKGSGKGSRTVRRWAGGETPIPYAVWCLLAEAAGYGLIWKK